MSNLRVIRVPERENRNIRREVIFIGLIAENSHKLKKYLNTQIQEAHLLDKYIKRNPHYIHCNKIRKGKKNILKHPKTKFLNLNWH